jgi:hypothetical protein
VLVHSIVDGRCIIRFNISRIALKNAHGWTSPLLGIRFELVPGNELTIREPDGEPFMTFLEMAAKADRLAAKLKEMGIDPDEV